ncbi:MAG: glycerol kinase, partial [Bacillales bacterium]|nr:glycerol kinase [Bacillales bacterium]
VKWLRDEVKLINSVQETSNLAKSVNDTQGVYFVPAFTGLGTPYWDDQARGSIFGLSRGSKKEHIVRAALEAIAYQSKDVFEVMKKNANLDLVGLSIDGGASSNDFLCQFQADILNCNIYLPAILESTALGGAYLAGLEVGFFTDLQSIKESRLLKRIYRHTLKQNEINELYSNWKKAVKACQSFK